MAIIASGVTPGGVKYNICSGSHLTDPESIRRARERERELIWEVYGNIARRGNPDELKRMEEVRRKYER